MCLRSYSTRSTWSISPSGYRCFTAQLVAVGLADGAGLVGPLVPDVGVQILNVVGLLLPDPQQLVHRGFGGAGREGATGARPRADNAENPNFERGGAGPLLGGGRFGTPNAVGGDPLPGVGEGHFIGAGHGPPSLFSIFLQVYQTGGGKERGKGDGPKFFARDIRLRRKFFALFAADCLRHGKKCGIIRKRRLQKEGGRYAGPQ